MLKYMPPVQQFPILAVHWKGNFWKLWTGRHLRKHQFQAGIQLLMGPLTPCTRNAVKLIPHATTPVRKCPKQDNLNWSPGPALTPPWSMSTPMPKMGKTWKASVKKTAAKVRKFRSSGRRSCTKTKSKSKTPGPEPRQLNLTFAFDSNP